MIGFSVYLGEPQADLASYLKVMQDAGFSSVYTSLHVPEDEPAQVLAQLRALTAACRTLHLTVVADVSPKGLARLGVDITDLAAVQALGVTGLRIDDGVAMPVVARLSRHMPIALNASTIGEADLAALKANQADFGHLQAWHNYYPREDTGLATAWYHQKNVWLHQAGLKTMGFVPGDSRLRGPVHAGLPTLEKHRHALPLAAALALQRLATDLVYVGDPGLTPQSLAMFRAYTSEKAVLLTTTADEPRLESRVWHNRPDVAANVVRLAEGRVDHVFGTPVPQATGARPAGSITVDNGDYARYAGEVQITKCDLPADPRVNVIGHIAPEELPLLNLIGAGQAVRFHHLAQA